MRRVNLFLAILIACLIALVALTVIGFAIFSSAQNPYNWMSQMWSGTGTPTGGAGGMMGSTGMMGQTGQTSTAINSLLPYFGVLYAVFVGLTIAGIIGLAYYIVYPQIRIGAVPMKPVLSPQTSNTSSPYESVSKTLTDEERKIVEVLNNHNGKYLQKYIRNETGLSRLKTHRIIARLAEREIVTLEKTGNTNQVYLASWLQNKKSN